MCQLSDFFFTNLRKCWYFILTQFNDIAWIRTVSEYTTVLFFRVHSDSLWIALSKALFTVISPFILIAMWFMLWHVLYSVSIVGISRPTFICSTKFVAEGGRPAHLLRNMWVKALSCLTCVWVRSWTVKRNLTLGRK